MADNQTQQNTQTQQNIDIQRIYIKDLSLETPGAPDVFLQQEQWEPQTNIDLNIQHKQLKDNHYEVVLRITVTITNKEQAVLVTEVKQAAIFNITGFNAEQLDHVLGAYCPSLLFPYAREAISSMSIRATMPPINLAPLNFDAIYQQQKANAANNQSEAKANSQTTH
ncbi:MAG: protein-export chaperone SecB [Pseudomonadota bacterium]